MALDADTGKVVWEYKFNLFQSDVPAAPHRLGLAGRRSGDRQHLRAQRRRRGDRAEPRRQAAVEPLVRRGVRRVHDARRPHDVAGRRRRPRHRQRGGLELGHGGGARASVRSRSTSAPATSSTSRTPAAGRTTRPTRRRLIATINGMRLLIARLGDGGVHAIKPQTGEKVWSFVAAKRAINTGVVGQRQQRVRLARRREPRRHRARADRRDRRHPDRRHQDDEVGRPRHRVRLLVAADRRQAPVSDRQRLDVECVRHRQPARQLWTLPLGTAQKAPPVLADGKIYVGTDGGKFFIVRPHADRGEILSKVELPNSTNSCCGSEGTPEQVLGSAAISRGRIFFVSSDAIYAIGSKQADVSDRIRRRTKPRAPAAAPRAHAGLADRARLEPGQTVKLQARSFDDRALPARREGHLGARGARRHGRRRRVHGREQADRAGRAHQSHRWRPDRRGAGTRRASAALDRERSTGTPMARSRRDG